MKPLSYIAAIALSLFAVISAQGQTIKKYVGKFSVPVSNAILGIEMFSEFYRWDMYGTGYYHYYEKDGKRVWHGKFHIERKNFVESFCYDGEFTDGIPSGTWSDMSSWHRKPILYYFKDGLLDGPFKSDHASGQYKKGKIHGHWKYSYWNDYGHDYRQNRYYNNGVPDGEWTVEYYDKYGTTVLYRLLFDKGEILKYTKFINSTGETILLYENTNPLRDRIIQLDGDTTTVNIDNKKYIKCNDRYFVEEQIVFNEAYYEQSLRESGFRTEDPKNYGEWPSGHHNSVPSIIFSYDKSALRNHAPQVVLVTAVVYVDKTSEALEAIAKEEKQRQEEEKRRQECEELQKQLNAIRIQINDKQQAYRELYDKTYRTMSGNDFVPKVNLLNQWLLRIEHSEMINKKGEPDVEMILVRNNYLRQTPYKALKDKYSGSSMLKCYSNARMLLDMKPYLFDKKITPVTENIPEMKKLYSELVKWTSDYGDKCKTVIERYYSDFTTYDQDYNEAERIDKVIRFMAVSCLKIKKSQKTMMAEWTREQLEEYFLNLEIE